MPAARPKVWALLERPRGPQGLHSRLPVAGKERGTTVSPPCRQDQDRPGRPPPSKARSSSPTSSRASATRSRAKAKAECRLRQGRGEGVARRRRRAARCFTTTSRRHVGGKIAQLGSRLIDGVAKNMADKFFASFAEAARLAGGRQAAPAHAEASDASLAAADHAIAAPPAASTPPRRHGRQIAAAAAMPPRRRCGRRDRGVPRSARRPTRRSHGSGGYGNGSCLDDGKRPAGVGGGRSADAARAVPARKSAPDRHACRLRHLAMRRLRRPRRRPRDQVLHGARGRAATARRSRRSRASRRAASCTRCSRRSRTITACNAASARRA